MVGYRAHGIVGYASWVGTMNPGRVGVKRIETAVAALDRVRLAPSIEESEELWSGKLQAVVLRMADFQDYGIHNSEKRSNM